MSKQILATLESYNGLPADMVERLRGLPISADHVFEVKKIEIANNTYKVIFEFKTPSNQTYFLVFNFTELGVI